MNDQKAKSGRTLAERIADAKKKLDENIKKQVTPELEKNKFYNKNVKQKDELRNDDVEL